MYCEPLGLEVVFTLIKDICQVTVFDMMADKKKLADVVARTRPDLVGFTTLCIDVQKTLELCKIIKGLDERIITTVGGTQTFFNPEAFFNRFVDHVFQYIDGKNIRQLITHIKAQEDVPLIDGVFSRCHAYKSPGQTGGVQGQALFPAKNKRHCKMLEECRISAPKKPGRNIYVQPDVSCTRQYRHLYSYFGYRPCAIMQTSTGCSAKCLFCMRWRLEGGKENPFSLKSTIDHIQNLAEPHVMIIDNDFFNDPARLSDFCDLLEKRGIKKNFICYASVNGVLKNEYQMARICRNGIKTVLVGYETFCEKELLAYKKQASVQSSYKAASILKRHNIDCWASFIMHPDWDKKDFKRFRAYIKSLKAQISTFSPLTPFPDLPLYSVYRDRVLAQKQDYLKWSFSQVTIQPLKLSLKTYYREMLKTILYINFVVNDPGYLIKRFGYKTMFRILKGSVRVFINYIRVMYK